MGAPRIGIWEIEDRKIKTFDCYPERAPSSSPSSAS
jgi:hypothetical protein